jgi:hypothetical protein
MRAATFVPIAEILMKPLSLAPLALLAVVPLAGCAIVSASSHGGGQTAGQRHSTHNDIVDVATGKRLCDDLDAILEDVKSTREARRATPLYARYQALLPKLDAPGATKETLAEARALRDEYLRDCMTRPGWTIDECRSGEVAEPLTVRIIRVAIAQRQFALAYAENAFLHLPPLVQSNAWAQATDQSGLEEEFLSVAYRSFHGTGRRLDSTCRQENVWRLPGAGPRPERFDMRREIVEAAGVDRNQPGIYVKGKVKTVGTGPTATVTFTPIITTGTYEDNCRLALEDRDLYRECDVKKSRNEQYTPAPLQLVDGDAVGLAPEQIIEVAIDPKTRRGYLIKASSSKDWVKARGFAR